MLKVDAIVLSGTGKVYFFEGSQYVRYDLESFRQDPGYPQPIAGNWPGLWESDIDAATNWGSSDKAFFFKGSEYIGYDLQTDTADEPKPIEGNWSGVWDSDIDAALDWGNGKLYLFKGSEYVRYDIAADKADDGYPQRIEGNWTRLWSENIDAAVNWGNGKAYFFRGDEYVSYDIAADAVDSGYPRKIAGGWPPSSATAGQLSAGRQNMLDLIDKWMPTSLNNPRVPSGETRDLMAKAGWTKATGQDSKKKKDAGEGFATSCGDVLHAMLVLWKSNFLGFFNIRDTAVGGPGAKARGFYVERDQLVIEGDVVKSPKPGDIIVLRNGVGKGATGVGHVGILVEARKDKWKTADGGGGSLPDQTAAVTERDVRWVDGVPIMKSVTDIKEKELDGWVDLDRIEQTGG
jgi:hypothetical protein